MKQYVYFSIMFFSLIILFLYIYIIYEKNMEIYKSKKMGKYVGKLVSYIDFNINQIIHGEDISYSTLKNIRRICKNKDKREIVQERLSYYLENFKGDFFEKLIEVCQYIGIVQYEINNLKDKNCFKKALAAKRLGEYRSKKAIEPLLNEINTTNSDVKYNILLALTKIGEENSFIKGFENINSTIILSERSLIEIVDSFEGDKNKIYKYMINSNNSFIASIFIKSAGNHKDISLSDDISKHLFSENKEMRIAAVKAIGSIGDARYLDDMIKLLEDEKWEVRAVTAKALNNFTEDKILLPLAKSLSDPQWHVRYNAATSILNDKKGMNVISYILQLLNTRYFILFLAASILYGIILSIGAILLEEYTFSKYPSIKQLIKLSWYGILENFGYRQMTIFFRIDAMIRFKKLKNS